MYKWSLEKLYKGLDDPRYNEDNLILDQKIKELDELSKHFGKENSKDELERFVNVLEEYQMVVGKLFSFVSLTLATDSTNPLFNNAMIVLRQKILKTTLALTLFEKYVARITDLEDVISKSKLLSEYKFMLLEIKEQSVHLLSDEEEVLAAELNQSGGSLFTKMQTVLTSTLEVEYNGEVISLPKVRNLAYDKDPMVRKDAYFAELAAYKKIDKPMSFALNGIKKEVITMSRKRKYSSPLERTLDNSRINQAVLDALISAMKEYLVDFRRYLKRKAEVLGHKNGLPWYDLFAPMGKADTKYTVEEAQEFILKNFKTFSDDLHDMAKRAFEENWIDYLPYPKKQGGAFCSRIYPLKESRILANFDGTISDISTLAHELGHAYHNLHIFNERIMNSHYPMPIAETASILCETIVKQAVLREAKEKEVKLGILEQELQDSTQVIVDILSRFIFESNVFKRSENEFLNEEVLNQMMIDAQKEAYGDGLDQNYLNSGMWINKGHYYSTGRSFYNFPYAFGLLFAKGIYAKYKEEGSSFVGKLQTLLRESGKNNLMEVAKLIDIDITDINFWRSSLEVIKEDIEEFLRITN
jgi:pepF/M3 family oligoendopeptidase